MYVQSWYSRGRSMRIRSSRSSLDRYQLWSKPEIHETLSKLCVCLGMPAPYEASYLSYLKPRKQLLSFPPLSSYLSFAKWPPNSLKCHIRCQRYALLASGPFPTFSSALGEWTFSCIMAVARLEYETLCRALRWMAGQRRGMKDVSVLFFISQSTVCFTLVYTANWEASQETEFKLDCPFQLSSSERY